ncbi:sugar transporter SWEET1 isoform X1 [Aplysia californica]|uniref:Sugar transporter SWEET n=1 Tax=Aplysia californica TaxID=6500 RepID=A0ABM0JQX2_APLCA|nr:sugar transporter SWEET1 isoform X1 [Aplysia californica]
MDFVTIVEWATVVVTFVMIGSGSPICINMYKQKSTRNVPYLLFLISAFVSTVSLQYGLVIKNSVLILINVVAVLVWGLYISVYILVSKSKTLPLVKLMSVVLLYWGHLLYLESVPKKDVISTLGVFLIVWCVVAYLIPALDILTMVREKSAASCDLSLLLGGTLSASVWYLYGVLVEDVNIYLPCIIGLVVSGIKFFLMLLYRSGPKKSTTTEFSKVRGGDKATEFHEEVYRVSSRDGLRQRM